MTNFLDDLQKITTLSEIIFKAGKCPKEMICTKRVFSDTTERRYIDLIDKDQTLSLMITTMLRGLDAGIPPIQALYNIVWYNERPCVYGDIALAMVQKHSEFICIKEKFEGEEGTNEFQCVIEIFREKQTKDGSDTQLTTRTFSWGDAVRANLHRLKHYREYPNRMLLIRARAWALRDAFADILNGLSMAEEQIDIVEVSKQPTEQPATAQEIDEFTKAALEEADSEGQPELPNLTQMIHEDKNTISMTATEVGGLVKNECHKIGEQTNILKQTEHSFIIPNNKDVQIPIGTDIEMEIQDPEIRDVDVDAEIRTAEEKHKARTENKIN